MQEASDTNSRNGYAKEFAVDINKHINDVSEKYIITGETAPIALMFVASEGVFRAIEDSSHNFVKKARAKNVVILSPNTFMEFSQNIQTFDSKIKKCMKNSCIFFTKRNFHSQKTSPYLLIDFFQSETNKDKNNRRLSEN